MSRARRWLGALEALGVAGVAGLVVTAHLAVQTGVHDAPAVAVQRAGHERLICQREVRLAIRKLRGEETAVGSLRRMWREGTG